MNCHDDKNNNHNSHNPLKHMLHMATCCGLPILVVAVVPLMKFLSPAIKNSLLAISPFLCPLMMLFMIPMMFKGMKGAPSHNHKADPSTLKNLESNDMSIQRIEE